MTDLLRKIILLRPLGAEPAGSYPLIMKNITLMALWLTLATPAFATTIEERTAQDQRIVNWMEWVEICTTNKPWRWSDAERLKVCLLLEQQLRDHGSCMYSPGVIGIWDGKHCR